MQNKIVLFTGAYLFLCSFQVVRAETSEENQEKREYISIANNALAGIGTVQSGKNLPPGSLSLSMDLGYFGAKDFIYSGDYASQSSMALNLGWAIAPFMELALHYHVISNYNTQHPLLNSLVFGDPTLSLKFPISISDELYFAPMLHVRIPSGDKEQLLDLTAPQVGISFALSYFTQFGLHLHLNAGYVYDNTISIFSQEPDVFQRFSWNLSKTNQLHAALGISLPVTLNNDARLVPFVTSQLVYATENTSMDSNHGLVSIGLQWWYKSLGITAGSDIRITGEPDASNYLPGIPPYRVFIQFAYNFSLSASTSKEKIVIKEKIVEKVVEKKVVEEVAPPTWVINGNVKDAANKKPVAFAKITIKSKPYSPVAVEEKTGNFLTYPLEAGKPAVIVVSADGYHTREMPVSPAEQQANVKIELQPTGKSFCILKGNLRDYSGKPLSGRLYIPKIKKNIRSRASSGTFEAKIPPGKYDIIITVRGYQKQKKWVEVQPGEVVILNVDMKRK